MLRTTIQYVRSPEVTAREFKNAVTGANAAAVKFWYENYAPGHFEAEAANKYGYQPRKGQGEDAYVPGKRGIVLAGGRSKYGSSRVVPNPKYYFQKQRQGFGTVADVRTGASRDAAKSAFKISSTSTGARGVFTLLPRYFYQYRKDYDAPDKAKELVTVLDAEVQAMAKFHEKFVEMNIESIKQAETVAA
jgi:hypothetical protein